MRTDLELQNRTINTIRFLSADAIQKANSGHPGLPMGTAAIAYTIWTRHLRVNPAHPGWENRDRFVLSGGHGSMMLYSLLHLAGYDLSLDDIKAFRQWDSLTPGHPEYGLTPGVETTTGPLGQGFANGVGMAIAEAHLAGRYNQPDFHLVDHYVYGIVTDGDLMEGVASEAASLAGHLRLGKLIYLYDDNRISIDGSTDLTFTEDRGKRFEAYGWHVLHVEDGNDVEAIDQAICQAKLDPRPSLIICRTHIGFGLPTRQDTAKAHGEPPGDEELNGAKTKLGWPLEPRFLIPEDVLAHFREIKTNGERLEGDWKNLFKRYQKAHPQLASEFKRVMAGELPAGWDADLPEFAADAKGIATRVASGKALNALAVRLPELMGGSADLTPSNNTALNGVEDFNRDSHAGRYLHFGVREHGMASVVNGMAYHKGIIPFGATFMVFTDYMRPAIRVSALSHLHTIWVMTHDSIGLGEDGPTHQPVEHLASLRAIPNLTVIRPADANEAVEAWKIAVSHQHGPVLLALSRQATPTIDRGEYADADGLKKGAYILADLGGKNPQVILMATGTEVDLALKAGLKLAEEGIAARVVSFPSWELFEAQDASYRDSVLPSEIKLRVAIEAGISQGWERWVGDKGRIVALDRYGASAPAKVLMEKFGFTVENVIAQVHDLLKKK